VERSLAIDDYEVELSEVYAQLKDNNSTRILVQAPDGLKRIAVLVAEKLGQDGYEVYLSGSHAWGGCDIAVNEARSLDADTILHIGHHGFVGARVTNVKVLFVPVNYTGNFLEPLKKALEEIMRRGYKSIALGVTIELHKRYGEVEKLASSVGLEVRTGFLGNFKGLVIGCNYSALPEADAILIVAGGKFHALGAALWTRKIAWCVDPYLRSYGVVDAKPLIARRLRDLSLAMDARSFLIVVSSKTGQLRLSLAGEIKRRLEQGGRKAVIVVLGDVSRDRLLDFGNYDAYVNTACPRLVIDDPDIFPGPVVNPGELKYVLTGRLENYDSRDLFRLGFALLP
jgi:2-(3-amino-3-carboxypropyl)histidine synthase